MYYYVNKSKYREKEEEKKIIQRHLSPSLSLPRSQSFDQISRPVSMERKFMTIFIRRSKLKTYSPIDDHDIYKIGYMIMTFK